MSKRPITNSVNTSQPVRAAKYGVKRINEYICVVIVRIYREYIMHADIDVDAEWQNVMNCVPVELLRSRKMRVAGNTKPDYTPATHRRMI